MKGWFQQYGDSLFFAAPISLWLTSRYLISRNIKPNFIEKIKKGSFIGMEVHIGYRFSKECYSLYQTVSNGESAFSHFSSNLKDNFFTRLFMNTFYFYKSIVDLDTFHNFSLIALEVLKSHSEKSINIVINMEDEEKNKKEKTGKLK